MDVGDSVKPVNILITVCLGPRGSRDLLGLNRDAPSLLWFVVLDCEVLEFIDSLREGGPSAMAVCWVATVGPVQHPPCTVEFFVSLQSRTQRCVAILQYCCYSKVSPVFMVAI